MQESPSAADRARKQAVDASGSAHGGGSRRVWRERGIRRLGRQHEVIGGGTLRNVPLLWTRSYDAMLILHCSARECQPERVPNKEAPARGRLELSKT